LLPAGAEKAPKTMGECNRFLAKNQCRWWKELNPNQKMSHGVSKLGLRAGGGVPPHANFQAVDAMIKVMLFSSVSAKFALRAGD
jgi:hypothetical protein